jgi:hypothetical protein
MFFYKQFLVMNNSLKGKCHCAPPQEVGSLRTVVQYFFYRIQVTDLHLSLIKKFAVSSWLFRDC